MTTDTFVGMQMDRWKSGSPATAPAATPTRTRPAPPDFDNIPAAMRDRDQWILWKLAIKGDGKTTKIPWYVPHTDGERSRPRCASSTNPKTWSTFEKIKADFSKWGEAVDQVDGIGFVFVAGDGIVGIDVDHKRNIATGLWEDGVLEKILSFNSYAELSQSGTGAHVIVIGEKPGTRCRSGDLEIYDAGRFFVMTGRHIPETPSDVMEATAGTLEAVYREIDDTPTPIPTAKPTTPQKATTQKKTTPNTVIIDKARAANGEKFATLFDRGDISGYASASEADAALCGILRFWTQANPTEMDRIFRQSAIYRPDKWDTKRGSSTYGDTTIRNALEWGGEVYREGKTKKAGTSPAASTPEAAEVFTPEVELEAKEILEHGDPLAYMIETFNREHVGDKDLAKCLVLSLASRLIENSKGLHVQVSGASGKGKSDGYRVMLQQVPAEFKLEGSFSDKSLFYMEDRPRTVILIDDKEMTDALREIMKSSTSSFSTPITHHTVLNGKPTPLTIAERCLWWSANVDSSADEQEINRVLSCWVNDSAEQDEAVYQAAVRRELRKDPPGEPRQVAICRAMWTKLQEAAQVPVMIFFCAFVEQIGFMSKRNRRDNEMFFDMIRSAAMINFFQRDRTPGEGGAIQVDATPADFTTAASVFQAIHGEHGGQGLHLSSLEKGMLETIANAGMTNFTAADVAGMLERTPKAVTRMFTGRTRRDGSRDDGLSVTCPAITVIDRSVSIRDMDDGRDRTATTISDRANHYVFDLQIYRKWILENSGGVWLNPPDSTKHEGTTEPQGTTREPHPVVPLKADIESGDGGTASILQYNNNIINEGTTGGDNAQLPTMIDQLGTIAPNTICVCPILPKCGSVVPLNSKSDNIAPIENQSEHDAARGNHTLWFSQAVCGSVVPCGSTLALSQVQPEDYSKSNPPLIQSCEVCGGRVCHYTEKFTVMKARGGDHPRHICKNCHTQARDREQAAVQMLPGAILLADLVPVQAHASIGMCSACGTDAAAFTVPGTETAICQICYGKLARDQVDIR